MPKHNQTLPHLRLRERCGRGGRNTVQRIRVLAVRLTLVTAEATFAKSPHHDHPNRNWTRMMPTAWMPTDSPQGSKPTERATDTQVKLWVREVALCRKSTYSNWLSGGKHEQPVLKAYILLECVYHALPSYNAKPILGLVTTLPLCSLTLIMSHIYNISAKPYHVIFHSHISFPHPFLNYSSLPPFFPVYLLINNTSTYFYLTKL